MYLDIHFGSDISSNGEDSNPRLQYAKRHWLMFKTIAIVIDQLTDVFLIVTLFVMQQYWFAIVYMMADILPAAVLMLHQHSKEKSWKVIVSGMNTQSLFF